MWHFLFLSYPYICSGEGKNLRKYEVSFKLRQSFILIKKEKTSVDFMIIDIQILSFGGFYFNKICMMMKLHKNMQIPRLMLGFQFLRKYGCNHVLLKKKINDPEICHFLIVLYD